MKLKKLIEELNILASENPEYLNLPVVAHVNLLAAEISNVLYSPSSHGGEWYDISAKEITGSHIVLLSSISN